MRPVVMPPRLLAATALALALAAVGPSSARAVDATSAAGGTRPAAAVTGRGVWPVHPVSVVAEFRPPLADWRPGHRGLDLAAGRGQPVVAPVGGVVTFAAVLAGRGVVVVRHGALRSSYEPVATRVRVGDVVATGEVLGRLGAGTGHCGADPPCLHWGLRRGDAYLDPRLLLGWYRPVLRPPRG